jgi:CRISPR-associated endoribonuclease Cas6
MPSTLVVRMAGAIPDVPPRWLLTAASAICEPAGGTLLGQTRPFSVGALLPGSEAAGPDRKAADPAAGGPADGAVTTWRLGWLDDDAAPPGWAPAAVRFGSQVRTVIGADLRRHSYAELAQGRPARRVRLTMNTPTFFSRDGRDLPLPDPALAVGGLLPRWNAYAPAPLRIGAADAQALVDAVFLDGVWGASAEVELGHGLRQVGFVGQADLRLVAATSDYTATMFTALARFAAFAGVGARTAYGFGAVDVDVIDLVPPPRRLTVAVPASRRADATAATSLAAGTPLAARTAKR